MTIIQRINYTQAVTYVAPGELTITVTKIGVDLYSVVTGSPGTGFKQELANVEQLYKMHGIDITCNSMHASAVNAVASLLSKVQPQYVTFGRKASTMIVSSDAFDEICEMLNGNEDNIEVSTSNTITLTTSEQDIIVIEKAQIDE